MKPQRLSAETERRAIGSLTSFARASSDDASDADGYWPARESSAAIRSGSEDLLAEPECDSIAIMQPDQRQLAMEPSTPNHALQRTAPRVTVAANSSSNPSRPSVALSYARCLFLRLTTQLPRHAPPSLSLGSLGDSSRYHQL